MADGYGKSHKSLIMRFAITFLIKKELFVESDHRFTSLN